MSRAIGLAEWDPNYETLVLIEQVQSVLTEYRSYLPMTGRQIFYRLVGNHDYAKTEKAYKSLLEKLVRARRAGLIPWSAIRDDGVTIAGGGGWSGIDEFANSIRGMADGFWLDPMIDQPAVIELWCEAQGMVPQMERVAGEFGILVYSSGGFNSVTMKHNAATRFIVEARDRGRSTILLHVGDHDPSGVAIYDNLELDLNAMIEDYGRRHGDIAHADVLITKRIAVTQQQADDFGLDSAPPKSSDSRTASWEGDTYQVEAMSPANLASEVSMAIDNVIDAGALAETEERQVAIRERLVEWVEATDFTAIEG